AHSLQRDHQLLPIRLRQETAIAPLHDDASNDLEVLIVKLALQGRHLHEDLVVDPARQLLEDFLLVSPNQDRLKRFADLIQVAIHVEFAVDGVVIHHLEEGARGEAALPAWTQADNDINRASAETLDLALPLVLERGRTDDEDPADAEESGHDFGRGDGLDRF